MIGPRGLQAARNCTRAKHVEKLKCYASKSTTRQKIQTGHSVSSRLELTTQSSRELMAWPAWDFYPIVQQLAQLFNFWHAWQVCNFLAACKLRATREIQSWVPTSLHNLKQFFTLFHTLPLYDSHLNTGLLIAKMHANLARNKANKMVD